VGKGCANIRNPNFELIFHAAKPGGFALLSPDTNRQMKHVDEKESFDDLHVNYQRWLPESRDAAVLDLGCGRGRVIRYLASLGFENVMGVDIDKEAVDWVLSHSTSAARHVRDLGAFLDEGPGPFALVIAKDVINYFPRSCLIDYLSKIKNILAPDGRFLVEVSNGAAFTGPFIKYKDYRIEWTFTEHSLRAVLEDAGFFVEPIVGKQIPGRGLRRSAYRTALRAWQQVLHFVYVLERGLDTQNPSILSKQLIALARPNH
jgi:SAM-dependent methyltransferase